MEHVDYEGNGSINYTEFLSATVSVKSVLTYEKLWALFKHFDTDDSGTITPDNLK
jgi:calcium-dependent protein kinase